MRRVLRLLLVASVLYGTGAHWAALQGYAWTGMLVERANGSSWTEAVKSTFSGEKPCGVCRVVEKGAKTEQGPSLLRGGPALDLILPAPAGAIPVRSAGAVAAAPAPGAVRSAFAPPTPPPDSFLPA